MKTLFILFGMLAATVVLSAQEHSSSASLSIGGFAGYGINRHISDFRALPGIPCCSPGFESGSGNGLYAGVLAGYTVSPSSSVQLRLGYSGYHGTLQRDEVIGNTLVRRTTAPFDTTAVDIVGRHSMAGTLHTLVLEPAFVWSPFERLGLHAGLSGSYVLSADYAQKEELRSPSTVVFAGSERRTRNEVSGAIPDASPVLLHATAGVSYDVPIARNTVLAPELRVRVPLNSIAGVDWRVATVSFGAAFRVGVDAPAPIPLEVDTIYRRDTTVRVVAGLDAERVRLELIEERTSRAEDDEFARRTVVIQEQYVRETPVQYPVVRLTVAGIGRDGSRTDQPVVVVEEVQTVEEFPLVPYVFFGHRSAVLAETRQHVLTEPGRFDTTNLEFSALAVYHDLLNILGARMQRFPQSRVVITGCNSDFDERNDRELSMQRAVAVRRYLSTVWGIEPERLSVQARDLPEHASNNTTEDGRQENRRVELSADDPRLLAPVVLRAVVRTVSPPILECVAGVEPVTPATSWRLHIARDEAERSVLFDTTGNGEPPAIHWRPDAAALAGDTLLHVVWRATGENGLSSTDEQPLVLQYRTLAKKRADGEDVIVERFSLVLFDYNSAEIDKAGQTLLARIQERIRPSSRVRIFGYTDRTGEPAYNRNLAERRCRTVRRLLGSSEALIEPVGSDYLLFDNAIPEGRMYSRTVHIVIETPVREAERSN